MRIVHVVGARPNFMKIAPVMRALTRYEEVSQTLIHTGQHYDESLSNRFFEDLDLPQPDLNLGVGSASHGVQTGRIMMALEPILLRWRPDWVFTVGDVNSTLAASLTAAKLGIRVAHVEAGLRSHDWSMPEEMNRVLTDRLSHALFTTEPSASDNLAAEGIEPERIHFVGNVMIDTLDRYRARAAKLRVPDTLGLAAGRYVLVTLHRPRNVDDPRRLGALLRALSQITYECEGPVVLPLHPRTAKNIRAYELDAELSPLLTLAPLRYLEFLCLMDHAGALVTDSGGVQEEASVLGVPCVTLRPNTERPITLTEGTNRLFTGKPDRLADAVRDALLEERKPCRPELWDGRASERIARVTVEELSAPAAAPEEGAEEPEERETPRETARRAAAAGS
ncbi:MAG: non-hydrolyzing UDP-N-acetylglucosamine 2-epimerase [Gemmatimonadota bacterium]